MTAKSAASSNPATDEAQITLRRFGPFFGAPDSSPFVIKTMMLLKLAGLAYRDIQGNPLKAPKKLLPYIEDGGEIIADSTFIRRHIERKYRFDFDAGLYAAQKAAAWAVERMCEDHLYFAMLEARWCDADNFKRGVGTMFGIVPLPLRPLAKAMLKKANRARLHGHGLGRHGKSDIAALARCDIEALALLLDDRPYLMGERPCGADATVFGLVTSILTPPLDTPLREGMLRHANLVAYRDRIAKAYFAEAPRR